MLAGWATRSPGSFPSLELAAPDICIRPRRARGALPPDLPAALSSLPTAELSGRDSRPAGQSQPGWHAPSPAPGASFCVPTTPSPERPPPLKHTPPHTHPGCTRPCCQRQPVAPSQEHCGGDPRVCTAERRLRAARAGSAEGEGGRERGGREARGGGDQGATPTRARPRGSRGQSARAGGAVPSAGRVHWPGARRPTPGDPAPWSSLQTRADGRRRSQVAEKGGNRDLSGKPVPTEHPRRSVCSGCRSLPVRDPLPTASRAAARRGQQPRVPTAAERQCPGPDLTPNRSLG